VSSVSFDASPCGVWRQLNTAEPSHQPNGPIIDWQGVRIWTRRQSPLQRLVDHAFLPPMARHASYDSDGLIIWARTIGCAVSFSCGTLGNHTRALTHPAGVPLHCCNGRSGSPALLREDRGLGSAALPGFAKQLAASARSAMRRLIRRRISVI
jgi:hypothetical protein